MLIFANVLNGIAFVLDMLLGFMIIVVIARAVISWVNPDPYNMIVRFLNSSTDPLLRPIRRYMPNLGAIDISPIILLLLLYFIRIALVQTLKDYAFKMRFSAGVAELFPIDFDFGAMLQLLA